MTINILKEICTCISKMLDMEIEMIEKNISKSLFGCPFYLQPEKLLYLYLYLENKYNIKFKGEDIINYKFSSIENISEIIKLKI